MKEADIPIYDGFGKKIAFSYKAVVRCAVTDLSLCILVYGKTESVGRTAFAAGHLGGLRVGGVGGTSPAWMGVLGGGTPKKLAAGARYFVNLGRPAEGTSNICAAGAGHSSGLGVGGGWGTPPVLGVMCL